MLTRREALWLCLAFLISLPAVTTRLYASDEIEYFSWLRSIAFDHDVDFQNEYQHFWDAGVSKDPGFHETFLERTNEVGRRVNYATPGPGLLWAPFYAVGHLVALATGAPADGFSRPYIAAVAYGSAFYGFLAVILSALVARRVLGRGLAPSAIVAIGTPLLFYAYLAPGFGHATSAFSVSLFVWIWIHVRERWSVRGTIALGVAGGLMGFVREQDVFLVIGPGVDFLAHAWRSRAASASTNGPARPLFATAAAGTVAFLAAMAPLFLAYYALNGHLGATDTAARKMNWTAPHAVSVLLDLEHGLLAWTPLALVAVVGLAIWWWRERTPNVRWIAGVALLMIAAQSYSSGSVDSWTVAGSFGQRRFVAITPLLVLGLAALVRHVRSAWPRRATLTIIALCVWWNLGLMAQFGLNRMDRQKLTLAENARMTFFELPWQAPSLAWRYLTNRESFYKLPRK